MSEEIAQHLVEANRSRLELQGIHDAESFKVLPPDESTDPPCLC